MDSGVSLADIAAVMDRGNNGGYGNNGMFGMEWIFALLILPALWGGRGGIFGNGGSGDNGAPVTEAGLCNAMNFNNLENAVGRLSDTQQAQFTQLTNGVCNLGYEMLGNFKSLENQISTCCCNTDRMILENRYISEQNTASINANTTAQVQKILDAICGNRMADMQNQINQLQLQSMLCGVVRYPNQTTFTAGVNPFFNSGCGCNCGSGYGVA